MTEKAPHVHKRRKWKLLVMPLAILAMSLTYVLIGTHTALAHGATTSPASRTYACYLEDPQSPDTPACQAAVAEGGTQPLYDWFGVLRSDGGGRTVGYIPDGQLCSGGNPKYAAYDAARDDWPATTLQSGATYTFRYAAWAAHPGGFRFWVTKDSYDPLQPLKWSDLEDQPFLTVDPEPSPVDGSYNMVGTLPANKHGRHIIYVVWTRSDSQETFYGCSDVIFGSEVPRTPTPTITPGTPTVTPTATPTRTGTTPTPAITPTPSNNGGACRVSYVVNQWPGGFTANMTVTNTGSSGVSNWNLTFSFPGSQQIQQGWNGTFSQSGSNVTITAASWNKTIPANGSVNPGFNASWSGTNASPTDFKLNGVACTIA